jgi:hypothetical protein
LSKRDGSLIDFGFSSRVDKSGEWILVVLKEFFDSWILGRLGDKLTVSCAPLAWVHLLDDKRRAGSLNSEAFLSIITEEGRVKLGMV